MVPFFMGYDCNLHSNMFCEGSHFISNVDFEALYNGYSFFYKFKKPSDLDVFVGKKSRLFNSFNKELLIRPVAEIFPLSS
jgi:hypothetical protein